MPARTIAALRSEIAEQLSPLSETAWLDAQVMLAHALGQSRTWVLSHGETELSEGQLETIESLAARLKKGEPLPYVLGQWEFYGLSFLVTPDVLIPRPETELLVEQALNWLEAHPDRRRTADVGVGSGCIAVSLAARVSNLHLLATDLSAAALRVAEKNTWRHRVESRVELVQADLLPAAPGSLDLICSNPPYIPSRVVDVLPVSRWEPRLALDGGITGLELVERLLSDAYRALAPGGLLLVEIEAGQGQDALDLGRQFFSAGAVEVFPDLTGRDRLLKINKS